MRNILELKDVWKIYKSGEVEVTALRGVNLSIRQGEFLAIMGKSGSGKSTMLNSIGSLDIPTKGKIYLDGVDISSLSESDLASIRGKKIGFIFQQFNLVLSLTALENVMLPMVFQGVPLEQRKKIAMQLLEQVSLGHVINKTPLQCSGGEQQRIAIARSLVNDPELILADEPTGNLDSTTGKSVIDFLKTLHKDKKKTIVMVTHDENLSKEAQRICVLKDGQIIKQIGGKND